MAGTFVQLTVRDLLDDPQEKVWINLDHVIAMRRHERPGGAFTVLTLDTLHIDENYEGAGQPPLQNGFRRVAETPEEILALAAGAGREINPL